MAKKLATCLQNLKKTTKKRVFETLRVLAGAKKVDIQSVYKNSHKFVNIGWISIVRVPAD